MNKNSILNDLRHAKSLMNCAHEQEGVISLEEFFKLFEECSEEININNNDYNAFSLYQFYLASKLIEGAADEYRNIKERAFVADQHCHIIFNDDGERVVYRIKGK